MSDSVFFLLPTNKLYKKENTRRLKNFPAGYVGSFYRNLADNIDTSSDFCSGIAADADIPKEDVQKYNLATSDFAKSIQTDINHYVTRDRINDGSFRQRLDPISKNILRRYLYLFTVFEDISKFDTENPIVGSLLREIDINKKQSDSDFIKSLPSHPGKEFESQKRLDRLRGNNSNNFKRNNNNNNSKNNFGSSGHSHFDRSNDIGLPPSLPAIEDFLDGGPRPPQPPPPQPPIGSNLFERESHNPLAATTFNLDNPIVRPSTNYTPPKGISNNLFGSQAAEALEKAKQKLKMT